jgi:hypothetical protein
VELNVIMRVFLLFRDISLKNTYINWDITPYTSRLGSFTGLHGIISQRRTLDTVTGSRSFGSRSPGFIVPYLLRCREG